MVQPVQSSISAHSIPFQPSTVNPLYKDQFGISTLTQAAVSRKSFIVLGFLALTSFLITMLIIFLSKLFKPTEIQAWVKENCKNLDIPHQEVLAGLIAMAKKEIDSTVNPSVRLVANRCEVTDCSCDVCKNIKIYILQYFEANGHKPNEIDVWMEQNCKDFDASHQELLTRVLAMAKKKIDDTVNPSLRAVASEYKIDNSCSCDVCENIKIYILEYFRAKELNPSEIDAWVEQNCNHLTEGDLFRVARAIQSASIKMESMVKPDVSKIVYTCFDSLMGVYRRAEDFKIIDCVLRYFRDKNQEIQTWLRKEKNTSEEDLAQVVQRVNEIEKLSEYSLNSEKLIRTLRLETFKNPDPIESKALSYLTYARNQASIKSKYGKK